MRKERIRIYDESGNIIKKECCRCEQIKEVKMFNKKTSSKDGYSSTCKDCVKEYDKQHYDKHKDKIKEHKKQYRKENSDKVKETQRRYYKTHKEEILQQKQEYYSENKENIIEQKKVYYQENKEKIKEYNKDYHDNLYNEKVEEAIKQIYHNFTNKVYPNDGVQYGVIYSVYNTITKRWYIGQTTRSFDIRYDGNFFKNKLKEMNEEKRKLLKDDLEQYGEQSFEINKILDVAFSPKELDEKEVYYIDYYKAYEEGYNSNRGYINGRDTLY